MWRIRPTKQILSAEMWPFGLSKEGSKNIQQTDSLSNLRFEIRNSRLLLLFIMK